MHERQRRYLHSLLLILMLALFVTPSTTASAHKVAREDCGKVIDGKLITCAPVSIIPPGPNNHPEPPFDDVTRVVLSVAIPPRFQLALDCHDKEAECAKSSSYLYSPPTTSAAFAQQLKDDYVHYPAPLRTANLTAFFKTIVIDNLLPWVKRTGNEPATDHLLVIDRPPTAEEISSPGTVVIKIRVNLEQDLTPFIGVLTCTIERRDEPQFSRVIDAFIPVPFDDSPEAISSRLDYFSRRLPIRFVPMPNDIHVLPSQAPQTEENAK